MRPGRVGWLSAAVVLLLSAQSVLQAAGQDASLAVYLPRLQALKRNGDWKGLERLSREALDGLQAHLGPDAADVGIAAAWLASALHSQRRDKEAERLLRRAIAIDEKAVGPATVRLALDLLSLTDLLNSGGRYVEAEAAVRRALAIDEKVLGPEHPDTATDMNNLAELLVAQGRYKDAEPLLRRGMAIDQKVLGPEHPDTTQDVANVAALLYRQGRYIEAEPLMRQVLAIDEKGLGAKNARTARDMNNLADLLRTEGRNTEAEPLLRRALALEQQTLGAEDVLTTATMSNLGLMFLDQDRFADAEPLFRRVLAIDQKVLGAMHPGTGAAANNLGLMLWSQGRYAEAEPLFRRALAITDKTVGEDDLASATGSNNLGTLLSYQGRYAEAEPLFVHASLLTLKFLGAQNPTTDAVLENYALNAQYLGKFADASRHYRLACAWRAAGRARDQNGDALLTARKLANDCSTQLALSLWGWSTQGGGEAAGDRPEALMLEAFTASQRAVQSAGSEAMSRAAALAAAVSAGVGPQAQAYEAALRERDELDAQFAKAANGSTELRAALTAARALALSNSDLLASELKTKAPRYWEYRAPKLVGVAALQSRAGADATLLRDDEALIVFLAVSGKEKGMVFAVTKEHVSWARMGLTGEDLTLAVTRLRSQIDPEAYGLQQAATAARGRPGAFDRQAAYALYQQLLGDASIQAIIKDKPTLLFVPSGPLTSLPPGLLVTSPPAGGRSQDADPGALRATAWLLRSKAVALLPAVSSLRTLRGVLPAQRVATPDPLLAFADPDFTRPAAPPRSANSTAARGVNRGFKTYFRDGLPLAEALDAVPSLPGTRVEGEALQRVLEARPGNLLMGRDASKAQLMARNGDGRLAGVRVLEFATHGLVAGDASDLAEPALVLAAGERPQDELLLASEAATLKINAEWVLLSACNTASPDAPEAQGLSGLSRAFFYAGARSLLVSHWRVRDDVAPVLIPAMLLAERRQPALSHAQSLRQASLEILDDPGIEGAEPSAWAAFTLIGEPGR